MFLVLWKSLSTNFPFTGNMGTNNEAKKVAYSRLSTEEKGGEILDVDGDDYGSGGTTTTGFYRTENQSELNLPSHNHNHNNGGNNQGTGSMKHSFSLDWNGDRGQRNNNKVTSSSWRFRRESSQPSTSTSPSSPSPHLQDVPDFHQIDVDGEEEVGKEFKIKSHSKFLSGIIFNDESDDDDKAFICDVCDRSFPTAKRLAAHQDKKRHFGCLQCDSIFPNRENLELHREQMNHFDLVSECGSETTSYDSDEEDLLENEDDQSNQNPEITNSPTPSTPTATSPSYMDKFQFFKRAFK